MIVMSYKVVISNDDGEYLDKHRTWSEYPPKIWLPTLVCMMETVGPGM